MIPEMEFADYIVILAAIPAIMLVFLPGMPALIIAFFKKRDLKRKIHFALVSCILSYGVSILFAGFFIAPLGLFNTFVTPKWEVMGHEDVVSYLVGAEYLFSSEFFLIPIIIGSSILIPFKLIKKWELMIED